MLERADTQEAIGLNQHASALLDQYQYQCAGKSDGLFYFGRAPGTRDYYSERLLVYDRAGKPCGKCGTLIRRLVQAARGTYYCPTCQAAHRIKSR
jgi:formamidopyrimidine-DNA glycosylase